MKWFIFILLSCFSLNAFSKEIFLDVRTPEEFSQGHIPGAININVLSPDFSTQVSKLNRSDTYKVYCRMGSRATRAVMIMQNLDFKNLKNLGSYQNAQIYYEKSRENESP